MATRTIEGSLATAKCDDLSGDKDRHRVLTVGTVKPLLSPQLARMMRQASLQTRRLAMLRPALRLFLDQSKCAGLRQKTPYALGRPRQPASRRRLTQILGQPRYNVAQRRIRVGAHPVGNKPRPP